MQVDPSTNPFIRRAPTQLHYGTLIANALVQNRRKCPPLDGPTDVTFQMRLALARGTGTHLQWDREDKSRPDEFLYTGDGLFRACAAHALQHQQFHEQHPSWYSVLQAFVTAVEQERNISQSTPLVIYLPWPNLDAGLLLSTQPVSKDERALVLLSFEDFWNEESILGEPYSHVEWQNPTTIDAGEYKDDVVLLRATVLNPAAVHVSQALTPRQLAELFFEVFLTSCERDIAIERAAAVLSHNKRYYDPGDLTSGRTVDSTVVHEVVRHLTPSLHSGELLSIVKGLYCDTRNIVQVPWRSSGSGSKVPRRKSWGRLPENASRDLRAELNNVHVDNASALDDFASPQASSTHGMASSKQEHSPDVLHEFKKSVTSCVVEELLHKTPNVLPRVMCKSDLCEDEIQRHCRILSDRINARLSEVVRKAVESIFKARGFTEQSQMPDNGAKAVNNFAAHPQAAHFSKGRVTFAEKTAATEKLSEVDTGRTEDGKVVSRELTVIRKRQLSSVEDPNVRTATSYTTEHETEIANQTRKFGVNEAFASASIAAASSEHCTRVAGREPFHANQYVVSPEKYLADSAEPKSRLLDSHRKLEPELTDIFNGGLANHQASVSAPAASSVTSNAAARGSLESRGDTEVIYGNRRTAHCGCGEQAENDECGPSFGASIWDSLHTELAYWVVRAKTSDRYLMDMVEYLLGTKVVGSYDLARFICCRFDAETAFGACKLNLIDDFETWKQKSLGGPRYWCRRKALIHRSFPASVVFYIPIVGLTAFSLVIAIKKGEDFWNGAEAFLNLFFTGAVAVVLALMGLSVGDRFVVWDYIMATAAQQKIPTEPEHRRAALRAICESENPSLYVEEPVDWMPHPCHGWTQIPQTVPLDEIARGGCLVISGKHLIANICGADRRMYIMDDGSLIAGEWIPRKGSWHSMVRVRNYVRKTVPSGSNEVAAVVTPMLNGSMTHSPLPSPDTTMCQHIPLPQLPRPMFRASPRYPEEKSERPNLRQAPTLATSSACFPGTEAHEVELKWVKGGPGLHRFFTEGETGSATGQSILQRRVSGVLRREGTLKQK